MALTGIGLKALLARLDAGLKGQATICLIGSGATILLGQEARQTEDVDVWTRASVVDVRDLEEACKAAGLTFDPKEEFPDIPYLQMVEPGLVQVPGWDGVHRAWFGEAEIVVWRGDHLTVVVPPARVIVASKLVRGEPQDMQDCLWLMAAHGLDLEAISEAVSGLPRMKRELARANLELLQLMGH